MNIEIAPKETEILSNWHDAKLHCSSLTVDGKTGWRLPTLEELNQIYESNNDFEKWYYWSDPGTNRYFAQDQNFICGIQGHGNKKYDNNYVRAIRDI